MHTPNIAVAEQQHAAWLLGYLCGVRPGSITVGSSREESQTLTWGDIDIQRQLTADGIWEGQFLAKITFKYQTETEETAAQRKYLHMTILSPKTNITLSLPHRLLVIALRRGLINHYESINELMLGQEENVSFKPDALSLPVLLATSPDSLSLEDGAAHTRSLTKYIRDCIQWVGYGGTSASYSWRKYDTHLDRVVGGDVARAAMAHGPRTTTFERYYNQGRYDLNLTGILIDGQVGQDADVLENAESLVLNRAIHLRNDLSRERALAEFVDGHVLVTEALANGATHDAIKQIKKRLKRKGLDALLRNEREIQEESRTIDEIRERIQELRKPSTLMRMVHRRIEERVKQDQELRGELMEERAEYLCHAEEEMESGEVGTQNSSSITIPDVHESPVLPICLKSSTAFMELLMEFSPNKL